MIFYTCFVTLQWWGIMHCLRCFYLRLCFRENKTWHSCELSAKQSYFLWNIKKYIYISRCCLLQSWLAALKSQGYKVQGQKYLSNCVSQCRSLDSEPVQKWTNGRKAYLHSKCLNQSALMDLCPSHMLSCTGACASDSHLLNLILAVDILNYCSFSREC